MYVYPISILDISFFRAKMFETAVTGQGGAVSTAGGGGGANTTGNGTTQKQ